MTQSLSEFSKSYSNSSGCESETIPSICNITNDEEYYEISNLHDRYQLRDILLIQESINLIHSYLPLLSSPLQLLPPVTSSFYTQSHFESVLDHIKSVRDLFNKTAQKQAAILNCINYNTWPIEYIVNNTIQLHSQLLETIYNKKQLYSESHFNIDNVLNYYSDDLEIDRLVNIATYGGRLLLHNNFLPQSVPNEMRHQQQQMLNVHRYHAIKMCKANQGILIHLDHLQQIVNSSDIPLPVHIHFNDAHWTSKPDNTFGRWIIDTSNNPINILSNLKSNTTKDDATVTYGPIEHPTTESILFELILYCKNHNIPLCDIFFWKEDIVAAFNQITWSVLDSQRLCIQLDDNMVFITISGHFGASPTPYIFEVIGRAILRRIQQSMRGIVFRMTDDFMGFGTQLNAYHDQSLTRTSCIQMCGTNSINTDKSLLPCKQGNLLGFDINLMNGGTICPNSKGRNKLLFVFTSIDFTKRLHKRVWQCLFSLVNRYSKAMKIMRAFVYPFNHAIIKCSNGYHKATGDLLFAILIWRLASIILFTQPHLLSISINSFIGNKPIHGECPYGISDASYWKICAAIYNKEGSLLSWTKVPLNFKDDPRNQYQQNREYIGKIITIILAINTNIDINFLFWYTDNTSAQSWSDKGKCQSSASQTANYVDTLLQLSCHFECAAEHIPGIDMNDIDNGSRDQPTPSLLPHLEIPLQNSISFNELLQLCDPQLSTAPEVNHLAVLNKIKYLLSNIHLS